MLNFDDFQYYEISFRKCVEETSVKGIQFYYIEVQRFKRLRKNQEKLERLIQLGDDISEYISVRFSIEGRRTLIVDVESDMQNSRNSHGALSSKVKDLQLLENQRIREQIQRRIEQRLHIQKQAESSEINSSEVFLSSMPNNMPSDFNLQHDRHLQYYG